MEAIKFTTRVGEDGLVQLRLPAEMSNQEVELILVVQAQQQDDVISVDEYGWPIGFFERTYGALADDPIERGEQLPVDVRDEVE